MDDRQEVDEEVEVVEDFPVGAGRVGRLVERKGVDVVVALEVVQVPGGVGEVAGERVGWSFHG
ncbi:hypothetical protein D3C59_36885 [Streptomyces sp. SHP22-7]|nr:hypothetical protein D3C59_36885 [Streptomyces sp. SHP22-7]